jgi:RNA polymerase sigma-70 factor (ECF subfamily)
MDRKTEFRRLYEAHRTAVHAYFVGRTGDRWTAADLMQDVFVRVWQRLPQLVGWSADRQRAWIFTTARNLSIDNYRHDSSRSRAEAAVAREPERPAPAPVASVLAAEQAALINEAVGRLPEDQRVTLAMAAAGGLTSAQIGDALGVPAGTVRYRLSRARAAVAAALTEYEHGKTGGQS